jgi:RNA-directed DNA polymerase
MAQGPTTPDLLALWRTITTAGGIEAYLLSELTRRGVLVARRETDGMSPKELEQYKKQLKAEAAERKAVGREAWRAYKATHIVHLGEGVFWTDDPAKAAGAAGDAGGTSAAGASGKGKAAGDKYDLPNAEERAAENELPPLDGPQQLADALGLTIPQLRRLAFHRDAATTVHYRRFLIPKRSGGQRAIWAPLPQLKAAQRWVLANVVERLPVHGAAHGFLTGRSTITNAAQHLGSRAVLKIDLKDFFPTVTLPRVKGVFRKAGYREQVATLLALLCTESPREIVEREGKTWYVALGPRCLPQGAPTSPGITNALCLRLDQRLTGLAARYGWRYTRYADDLTFSLPVGHKGKPHLGALLGLVRRVVKAEGFAVHPDKTRVSRSGGRQAVTGLVVNGAGSGDGSAGVGGNKPRVPRTLRRQLRAAAHNLSQGKPLKEGETLARLAGYAAYVHATDPKAGAALLEAFRAEPVAGGA